jgi:hypothetical protein
MRRLWRDLARVELVLLEAGIELDALVAGMWKSAACVEQSGSSGTRVLDAWVSVSAPPMRRHGMGRGPHSLRRRS